MLKVLVTSPRRCTNPNKLSKMVDGGDNLFLFGDDFEAILDILDEDEVLQEQFSTAASEVSAKDVKIYTYLVYSKGFTEPHATVLSREQTTVNKEFPDVFR